MILGTLAALAALTVGGIMLMKGNTNKAGEVMQEGVEDLSKNMDDVAAIVKKADISENADDVSKNIASATENIDDNLGAVSNVVETNKANITTNAIPDVPPKPLNDNSPKILKEEADATAEVSKVAQKTIDKPYAADIENIAQRINEIFEGDTSELGLKLKNNLKKVSENISRDVERAINSGNPEEIRKSFSKTLIKHVDSMDIFKDSVLTDYPGDNIHAGAIDKIKDELFSQLKKIGVDPLLPEIGTKFDANKHMIMETVKVSDKTLDETISGIFRSGFYDVQNAQNIRPPEVVLNVFDKTMV